jgi:cytochrome c oxidase subunit 2
MNIVKSLLAAGLLALVPAVVVSHPAVAQEAAPVAAPAADSAATNAAAPADAANAAAPAAEEKVAAPERMKPTLGIGMPMPGEYKIQEQFSPTGRQARWIHNDLLLPIITVISLFVLGLMLFIMVRFRRAANPNPSKTAHNTLIEVMWTVVPVLILVVIAVPSISLIAEQYKPAPKDAVTVKITGYQWYWGYEYPRSGYSGICVEHAAARKGAAKMASRTCSLVDNRLVLPVGRPIRLIITGADVIHSFAVPSLWLKLDAVPGRLNERASPSRKPGVYYGQCSELCGIKHGYHADRHRSAAGRV